MILLTHQGISLSENNEVIKLITFMSVWNCDKKSDTRILSLANHLDWIIFNPFYTNRLSSFGYLQETWEIKRLTTATKENSGFAE